MSRDSKVISEKYLGDEAARLRFLREARAAASVRHPNVASVFHLGRRGRDYFYAMEFVEGETLENLIKRSGPLEVKCALDVTMQVAAGLAAVHKKKVLLAFPWESDGAEIEFAEEKEDTGPEVLEGTETTSISLDGLDS